MSRVVWFAAGAVSGVYALIKAKRTAQNFTPDGVGARVAALGVGARMFAGEVSSAMATREAELRAELRLSGPSRRSLEPGADDTDDSTPGGALPGIHPTGTSSPGVTPPSTSTPSTPSTDGEGRHDGHR
jgi:hypothetical protein